MVSVTGPKRVQFTPVPDTAGPIHVIYDNEDDNDTEVLPVNHPGAAPNAAMVEDDDADDNNNNDAAVVTVPDNEAGRMGAPPTFGRMNLRVERELAEKSWML